MDSTLAPRFEVAVTPPLTPPLTTPPRERPSASTGPVMIGLQMVNWLVLMVLMSGFMLATTTAERSESAATSSEVGSAAPG